MIAHAIGPQNVERVSGIMARIAAAAVSTMGRKRRTVDSTIASQSARPRSRSASICTTRITELRMIIPKSAITPSIATKPKGMRNVARTSDTPIRPSGAVASTSAIFFMSCSCAMRSSSTTRSIAGTTAAIEACDVALDSAAPPAAIE
jgi:hypothetical protein